MKTLSSLPHPRQELFEQFCLYAVTAIENPDQGGMLDKIEAAYEGGADIIQLRSKSLDDAQLYKAGLQIAERARKYDKLYFVNDRVDLALATGADGVHVGQDDFPVAAIRWLAAKSAKALLVGKSTHSLEQAVEASREEVDYIGVGPVYATVTKPDYQPVGVDLVRQVATRIDCPFVTIGGIDATNIDDVLGAGARRIAVVRAIFDAGDIYESTRQLRKRIESYHDEKN